jgi:hypothetical protein
MWGSCNGSKYQTNLCQPDVDETVTLAFVDRFLGQNYHSKKIIPWRDLPPIMILLQNQGKAV